MAEQRGFFDLDERYRALSAVGDPLERSAAVVEFEVFGPTSRRRWRGRAAVRALRCGAERPRLSGVGWAAPPTGRRRSGRRWTGRPLVAEAWPQAPLPDGSARTATEIAVPAFGDKNPIGIDRRFGLIRTFAPRRRPRRRAARTPSRCRQPGERRVWADTAYRSAATIALLDRRCLVPQFRRARPRGKPMPAHITRGNLTRGRIRARVAHVFAEQKRRLGLIIRSVGLARATTAITLACNLRRLAGLDGQTVPA